MSYDSGVVICDSKFSTPSYVSIEDITAVSFLPRDLEYSSKTDFI